MVTVCLATGNGHKLYEVKRLFSDLPIVWKSLRDFPEIPDIVEDGSTFAENALIKARTVFEHTGILTLADDSGLEVDALGGAPGIYSARYGGEEGNSELNKEKLLRELQGVPDAERTGRFKCAAALINKGTEEVRIGTVEGKIISAPRGTSGFGYDPLFIPEGYEQTFAELGEEVKNEISHRAKAFKEMRKIIEKILRKL